MNHEQDPNEFTFDYFFSTINAYYRTAAVKTGLELGIFDAVTSEALSVGEIAERCGASVRGVRILCYFLASFGFLKLDNERFFITRRMAAFLSPKSPGYLGDSIEFLLSPYLMDSFRDLTKVVRTGEISLPDDGYVAPSHPQWVRFARAMASTMSLPAQLLATVADAGERRPLKVLDLAAGHGLFGISIARRNPRAHVTLLDWENVLSVARENATSAGVLDRVEFRAGDAFTADLGSGYDVVLLANFLHHFGEEECGKILRRVRRALKDDGRVITFEFIANEDRTSPPLASIFSMMMLAITPDGEAYTFSDLKRMFMSAEYEHVELQSVPPALLRVVVSYKTKPSRRFGSE